MLDKCGRWGHNDTMNWDNRKNGFVSKQILFFIVGGLVVIVAAGSAVYFYLQYQKSQDLLKNPAATTQQEVSTLVTEVGKLIVLPQGETPEVATVSDVEKLKGQQFFKQAKNGDKVLIYTKSQKAVLYDPTVKKIVEVGPINVTQATPTVSPTPGVLKVGLYNGTTTVGLTVKVEDMLKKTMPHVVVTEKSNAKKSTYTKTLVVDLSGKQPASAKKLAEQLQGEVGVLPDGEPKPADTDIIIILGKLPQ